MKIIPEFEPFIGGFVPRCAPGIFVNKRNGVEDWTEWRRLERYGRLFEALVEGKVLPDNEIQQEFVNYFRDPTTREPRGVAEILWAKYLSRVQLERDPDFKPKATEISVELPPMRGWNTDRSKPEGGMEVFFRRRR